MDTSVETQMIFCRACGNKMHVSARACPGCGAPNGRLTTQESDKLILPAALLCFFFGVFGVHRFYVGKVGTGILQLVTLGGFGIWALIDFIIIVVGSFRDADGKLLNQWT